MRLGATIKRIRKNKGLTQVELAEKTGIGQSYLSLVEIDKKQPSIKVLNSISEALGVATPFLVFYSIEESDVLEEKRAMYGIVHPHLVNIVDELVFGNCKNE